MSKTTPKPIFAESTATFEDVKGFRATKEQFAALSGVKLRTIYRWLHHGEITETEDGLIELGPNLPNAIKGKVHVEEDEGNLRDENLREDTALKRYSARRKLLEVLKLEGEVMSRTDVMEVTSEFVKATREWADSVPDSLERKGIIQKSDMDNAIRVTEDLKRVLTMKLSEVFK